MRIKFEMLKAITIWVGAWTFRVEFDWSF